MADKVIEALYEIAGKKISCREIEIEKSMKKAKVRLIRQVFEEFQQQMQPILEKIWFEIRKRIVDIIPIRIYSMIKFYDCYSTYPGLNYVVKKGKNFKKAGLELWFRN